MITKESIEQLLQSREIPYLIKEGHDEREDVDCIYFEVSCGEYFLAIDLADEVTVFFSFWHGHYSYDDAEVFEVLEGILDDRYCAVNVCGKDCEPDGDHGCCLLIKSEDVSRNCFIEEYGENSNISCRFFDKAKNVEFRI